jgi:hypothetical protein
MSDTNVLEISPQTRQKIKTHGVYKVTVPAGEYVLGDPCYSVSGDRWLKLINSTSSSADPIKELDGCQVLMFGTAYGDGVYQGPDGANLGVDSGTIGLVPVEMPGLNVFSPDGRRNDEWLTCRVTFDTPTVCERRDNGMLIFGKIRIKTA